MSKSNLKYFKISEFDSPDQPGSGANMKAMTLAKLDLARERAGVPFRINSAFRTVAHNRAVGGVPNSAHLTGHAVDIHLDGRPESFTRIVDALVGAGFRRIGVGRTYIHADDSPSLPAPAVWRYANDQQSIQRTQYVEGLLLKKNVCPCCGRELS